MDLSIFFVLLLFMALFIGGSVLVLLGGLRRRRRELYIGLVLLGLCIIFLVVVKNIKSLY